VASWIERYEGDYWQRRAKTSQALETWNLNYCRMLNRLPGNEQLTSELLVNFVLSFPADSQPRKKAASILAPFAKFAGLEVDLSGLSGNYSVRSVNPRLLPSDALIAETVRSINNPGWRWLMSLIACYGLRPHEAFRADLVDFPILRVHEVSKTGARFVYPLYPEWAVEWRLNERVLPRVRNVDTAGNQKLGQKVSNFVYRNQLPFVAYDLRHCYARRCFEFELGVDLGAQIMGHSPEIHKRTYRAWIDEATYRRVFDRLIYRDDRPKPPDTPLN
jgi:integrase